MPRYASFPPLVLSLMASQYSVAGEAQPQAIDPAFLPQACIFSAAFQQTQTLADIPKPLISEGKLFFNCETGLIWQQQSPLAETHIYARTQGVLRVANNNQLQPRNEKLQKNLTKLLNGLMGGDTRYINRYFKTGRRSKSQLELLPKRKAIAKFISRISIRKHPHSKEIFWESPIGNTSLLKIYQLKSYRKFTKAQCREWLQLQQGEPSCQVLNDEP
ncbi:MAG: hypothetical protein KTR17_08530 [Cellvibrionaceae bacterium]|nr:hypothetical protein [Cellvibrionaceae bacterium]